MQERILLVGAVVAAEPAFVGGTETSYAVDAVGTLTGLVWTETVTHHTAAYGRSQRDDVDTPAQNCTTCAGGIVAVGACMIDMLAVHTNSETEEQEMIVLRGAAVKWIPKGLWKLPLVHPMFQMLAIGLVLTFVPVFVLTLNFLKALLGRRFGREWGSPVELPRPKQRVRVRHKTAAPQELLLKSLVAGGSDQRRLVVFGHSVVAAKDSWPSAERTPLDRETMQQLSV